MADWGIQQPVPDFARSILGGYQAGAALGKQRQVQAALGGVDLSNPETIMPLLKMDPEHGSALLGASQRMLEAEERVAGKRALTDYLTARQKSAAGQPNMTLRAAPAEQGAAAPEAPAQGFTPDDLKAAEQHFMAVDPKGFMQVRDTIDKMDETQRARLGEAQEAIALAAKNVAGLPYEQRKAAIASQRAYLEQHFVTPEQIDGFDPTDANITNVFGQALGIKGLVEQQRADRADARATRNEARAERADGRAAVRFKERDKDRAALGGLVNRLTNASNDDLYKDAGF